MPERDMLGAALAGVAIVATLFAIVRAMGTRAGEKPARDGRATRTPAAVVASADALLDAPPNDGRTPIVTLLLSRAVIAPGTPVVAQVHVGAPPGTKFVLRTPTACVAELEVRDARGAVRATGSRECAQMVRTRTLTDDVPLVDTLLVDAGTPAAPALPPGRYSVRALVTHLADDGTTDTLRSAAVRLDVRRR